MDSYTQPMDSYTKPIDSHAKPIDISDPVRLLRQALIALGQDPQNGTASLTDLLSRAIQAWQVARIPMKLSLSAPTDYL